MEYNLENEIAKRKTKTIYRDNDSTIKLFEENYSKADILNEALNQARVEEGTDLKVPKLKEVTKINNRWALVTEYIEGKSLQELMDEAPEKIDAYLELFVKIQLEVLSKQVPLLNRIKDKFSRKLIETTLIAGDITYELLQRLEGMKYTACLCHGDFNPSNIILTDSGEYYIIDWAHVTRGSAAADSARTFLIFSLEGKTELAEKYLNLFCEKSNIDKQDVQRWLPIVAATQLTKKNENEAELLRKWIDVVEYN